MNWKNILYVGISLLLFSSCYNEDKIVPMEAEDEILRYEFPQGENTWDKDIVEISEKFGVHLIYKNFKHVDFNRSWTGAGTGTEMYGEDLTNEQAELCVKFMKNQIFAHLTPDILKKVLPDYWYLVYDYHYMRGGFLPGIYFKTSISFLDDGLDFWGICLFYGEPCPITGDEIETPEEPEQFRERRCEVLSVILQHAFNKGNITVPSGFAERFDYKTSLLTRDAEKDDPNFYITRGFPETGSFGNPLTVNDHFMSYVRICMNYTNEEYEEEWPPIQYPLIHEMRKFVMDYMKNTYNIDLAAIAELREGW